MWPNRRLCDLLKVEHPIIQAPMAGSATPELAAAVSNAGGLGSLGCAMMQPDDLRAVARQMRASTGRQFNLNFFVHPRPDTSDAILARALERVRPYYKELSLGEPPARLPAMGPGFDDTRLDLVLEIRPPVVSFHFGMPDVAKVARLKQAGIVVISTATNVAEARKLADGGADAVIAQGWEAGGHRGAHAPTGPGDGVGVMALVPQVVDAVDLPVIAAGGIADGRGIAAAFALGASGVQIGTGFLSCDEAGTDRPRRALIRSATDMDTMVSNAFSGRAARTKRTRYALEMEEQQTRLPDFPQMYALSGPLGDADAAMGRGDFAFHLYGQAAALNRELPAAQLLRMLVAEADAIFRALSPTQ
ncbi:NAD(P)H-dependent flavin oxidoreductase [Mesorhizobium sp. 131-2-1]|uniref:NAD(P)H-dependent flavin oxidoreductase n=1 Tax=Mesorhizobium sp. 131-2-1 TaxID=2744518 RepID=UPI0019282332|nr:nitronate monooxygenase [Mesorhizobium sp. 131-2-1]BCG91661.1 2-nitropropane dioxygenase [Mesorhizobium sp. 131-2-1]